MRRAIHLFATAGVAVSPASGLSFFGSDWGFDQRWKLLTCGIDLNGYAEPKRTELRAALEIPQDALLLGHVGRFHPDKNHHRLIAIAAAVMSWRPNTFLLLVGDGTNCAPLHKACRDAGLDGRVRILGARNDVPALLSAMDVFLFPSRSEGLGLACVEAQAAGLPVIASAKVPEQACVIPALFRRIDLASSNAVWVAAVFNSQLTPKLDPRLASEWIGKSAFNIDRSAANLSNLYLDALSGATRPFRHRAGEVCPR